MTSMGGVRVGKAILKYLIFFSVMYLPLLFVRNKLVGKMAAFTGSPHHLSNSSSEGNSAEISKAIKKI